jgi:uncharacterized tellurite resistance protein B-like protein
MIGRVMDFFTAGRAPAIPKSSDDLETAVAALLIEAARMDSEFDPAERATIARLLADRFTMTPVAAHDLIAEAERIVHESSQMFPFTREICDRIPHEDRVHIIEMLWKVAYADGVLDPHEDMLLRRIAGLIHVTDRERSLARRRALEKLAARKAR